MRGAVVAAIAVVVGVIAVTGIVAAVGNGGDHTGEAVAASNWADDVCGTVGAWEGQLQVIGDELNQSNVGTRASDGSTGDSVEATVTVRVAVDRAIQATKNTLREGLKRAGYPEANGGQAAAVILRAWALKTEHDLRVAKQTLKEESSGTSDAFASLEAAIAALKQSAVDGRAAFAQVAALDPALADALDGSDNCTELMKEQP